MIDWMESNQIFTGAVGGGIALGLLANLRSLPVAAWNLLMSKFSAVVAVHSGDSTAFNATNEWVSGLLPRSWSRRYRIRDQYDEETRKTRCQKFPHYGTYFFVWKGRFCVCKKWREEGNGQFQDKPREFVEIRFFGRDATTVDRYLDEIEMLKSSWVDNRVRVCGLGGDYGDEVLATIRKDGAVAPVLKLGEIERIETEVNRFLENEGWYAARGIPYRLGVILYGPPGTGKTSLVRYLASRLERDVHYVKASDIVMGKFANRVGTLPKGSIVLVEELDRIIDGAQMDFGSSADKGGGTGKATLVDIAGLLNSLDGLTAPHGVIFIFTANRIDLIDPAILRPGRCDLHVHLGTVDFHQANELHRRFFGEQNQEFARHAESNNLTPAECQKLLLQRSLVSNDMKRAA